MSHQSLPHAVATVDAVAYKGFFIVVTVRRAFSTKEMYDVINEIYRNLEKPLGKSDRIPAQEFASESDAYAFGVKEAKRWIDEQKYD